MELKGHACSSFIALYYKSTFEWEQYIFKTAFS